MAAAQSLLVQRPSFEWKKHLYYHSPIFPPHATPLSFKIRASFTEMPLQQRPFQISAILTLQKPKDKKSNPMEIVAESLAHPLKTIRKAAIAALLFGLLLMLNPISAFAASGGRMGGRSFSSQSTSSPSTSSSSTSSPSIGSSSSSWSSSPSYSSVSPSSSWSSPGNTVVFTPKPETDNRSIIYSAIQSSRSSPGRTVVCPHCKADFDPDEKPLCEQAKTAGRSESETDDSVIIKLFILAILFMMISSLMSNGETSSRKSTGETSSLLKSNGKSSSLKSNGETSSLKSNGETSSLLKSNGETSSLLKSNGETSSLLKSNGETSSFLKSNGETSSLLKSNGKSSSLKSNGETSSLKSTGETSSLVKSNGKSSSLKSTGETSLLKLQVGLLGMRKSLQKDLNRIAETTDTSTSKGFHYIMTETAVVLLRYSDYCISAYSSTDMKGNLEEGEKGFDQLCIEERAKFDEETLVNVDNVKRQGSTILRSTGSNNEHLVLTILVAAKGKQTFPPINNVEDLKLALQGLASIPLWRTLAVEVLWTPQSEDDTLSEEELLKDYPLLRPL